MVSEDSGIAGDIGDYAGPPTRILVVDDQRTLVDLLEIVINQQPDMQCVGTAGTGEAAVALAAAEQPEVVLTDYHLPDIDGVEVTSRVKVALPEARIIMLTGHSDDPKVMLRAVTAGVAGFMAKESPVWEILSAIRLARNGNMLIHPAALAVVLSEAGSQRDQPSRDFGLTPREREVLDMMGAGLDPQMIARTLSLSVHTCRGHVKNILSKLGVHSQLEAVVAAMKAGLIREPPATETR